MMRFFYRNSPGQRAFTLTELAVVVVVGGVLVCLFVTTALRNSRPVKRAQCASNLRQFGLAMQIVGNETAGRLPGGPGSGFWAWDIPSAVGTFVESTGCKWTVMYCPGTAPSFTQTDNWQLYNYTQSFRVIGYVHTLPGTSTIIQTNINNTLMPEAIQIALGVFVKPKPAERVLLADATVSGVGQNNPELKYSSSYNYVGVVGGYTKPHPSAHLIGRFPLGGNLAMLDGHVEWRQFKDMQPRTTGGSPVFWW